MKAAFSVFKFSDNRMNTESGITNYKLRVGLILKFILPIFIILGSLFLIPHPTHAQSLSPIQPGLQQDIFNLGQEAAREGLGERALVDLDPRLYIMRIVRGALTFVGLIFIVLIVWGGFQYMTSGGNREGTEKARSVLTTSVVGLLIMLSSYGIVRFVSRNLERAIFEQSFTQTQGCNTSNGPASCCREWENFSNASSDEKGDRYKTWQECQNREQATPRAFFRGIRDAF